MDCHISELANYPFCAMCGLARVAVAGGPCDWCKSEAQRKEEVKREALAKLNARNKEIAAERRQLKREAKHGNTKKAVD